jgi:sec-independent protein translocase protein TatA
MQEEEMPQFGVWELLIVLVIVLLIFGATRLKDIGKGLGGAVSAFRSEVKQDDEEKESKDES